MHETGYIPNKLLVSIIVPIIRPESAKRCLDAIRMNTGLSEGQYEVISMEDKKRNGCPKMVKHLTSLAKGEMICFLGDDTIPQPFFLSNAIRAMKYMPEDPKDKVRWGLVSFNDNVNTSRTAAHWLAHRRVLTQIMDGEFFHTGYKHCFCDDELMIRCQQAGRYIYAYDAILQHDHPAVIKDGLQDEFRGAPKATYDEDHKLFLLRLNNKWQTPKVMTQTIERPKPLKVVVGVPSGDMIHADFAMALVNLCIKSWQAGIHTIIVNTKSSIVEIGRCEIVAAAKQLNADKLLFLDSDMTFPADLLTRLIASEKEVIGCDALQRREPFKSVIAGMDGKKLPHADTLDPKLVEVKGVSCACLLIDKKVFNRLPEPPFMVTWNGKQFLGEDYYFGNAVRKAGFKIYCDMLLSRRIGHIGLKTYYVPQPIPMQGLDTKVKP